MQRVYRESGFPLDEERLSRQETLFHNANGYLGVRGTLEEGTRFKTMRGMYINGFYDIVPMKQAEKLYGLTEDKEAMLNVADTQTILIRANGELFSLFSGTVEEIERSLDMDAGVTERRITWRSPSGIRLKIVFKRMTSFVMPHLFTQECEITPLSGPCEVTVESWQKALVRNYADPDDPRLAADDACHLVPDGRELWEDVDILLARTLHTGLQVCTAVAHDLSVPHKASWRYDKADHAALWQAQYDAQKDETARLIKYTVMYDSVRSGAPARDALSDMGKARGGLTRLYQEQRAYLADFWDRADMEIQGSDEDNIAMLFNMYQLLQSAGRDGKCSVAAKGLSGEGYEGHYFWDTEMYMFPFYLLTAPQIARQLLMYRYALLPFARENAKLLGHKKGALYPWRTIAGRECSGYFPSGTAQYHISGDIAYAVTQYWLAARDEDFMRSCGAEMLLETARLFMDTGNWYQGRFHINDVTGPDEYTCIVNDNFYTNACARYNLEWAVRAVGMLKDWPDYAAWAERLGVTGQELSDMTAAAGAMCLPYDEETGINPQDDSFLQKPVWDLQATPRDHFPLLMHYHPLHLYRYQVCKQADTVLAYFIFDGVAAEDVMRRSFEYYEKITTHDSSLSTCVFSIVASRLGMAEKAERYFGDSLRADLTDAHHNTRDGIHTANMGGNYMAVVNGFAGLRLGEDSITLDPRLPSGWTGCRFRFCWQGRRLLFEMGREKSALTLLSGSAVRVVISGRRFTLTAPGDRAEAYPV